MPACRPCLAAAAAAAGTRQGLAGSQLALNPAAQPSQQRASPAPGLSATTATPGTRSPSLRERGRARPLHRQPYPTLPYLCGRTSSSNSPYIMFRISAGTRRGRYGRSTSGSTLASQNALQNSHDSSATPSSLSCAPARAEAARCAGFRPTQHRHASTACCDSQRRSLGLCHELQRGAAPVTALPRLGGSQQMSLTTQAHKSTQFHRHCCALHTQRRRAPSGSRPGPSHACPAAPKKGRPLFGRCVPTDKHASSQHPAGRPHTRAAPLRAAPLGAAAGRRVRACMERSMYSMMSGRCGASRSGCRCSSCTRPVHTPLRAALLGSCASLNRPVMYLGPAHTAWRRRLFVHAVRLMAMEPERAQRSRARRGAGESARRPGPVCLPGSGVGAPGAGRGRGRVRSRGCSAAAPLRSLTAGAPGAQGGRSQTLCASVGLHT